MVFGFPSRQCIDLYTVEQRALCQAARALETPGVNCETRSCFAAAAITLPSRRASAISPFSILFWRRTKQPEASRIDGCAVILRNECRSARTAINRNRATAV